MQDQLDKDLKEAMLSGDKPRVETLRGLKNAIQNETIAQGVQDKGLSDEEVQKVLSKEAKKRSEAIELYENAGETDRAKAEKAEKAIIDGYLPEQVSDEEIEAVVKSLIADLEAPSLKDMGPIIGQTKAKLGAGADGASIARVVKQQLEE